MSEWSSVNNPPPQAGSYLLLLGDHSMAVGYLDAWREWSPSGVYATYDGCGTVAFDSKPTHWQPLPAPPTE
ncbi:DUF551 domain-containing protein [Pseudomonas chlororaphis]|uniref:DUF551 domain-containing protein n=1 Tax=Pseudomonas chlororaphis TaxID=587753 RepID=UPI000586ADF2